MQLYRVYAKFEKHEVGDGGQWRVSRVWRQHQRLKFCSDVQLLPSKTLAIASTKPYPIGSIINPTKELNRVLKERRESPLVAPIPPRYVYIQDYMAGEHIFGEYDDVMKLYWLEDGDGYGRDQLQQEWPDAEFYQFKREGQTI